MHYRQLLAASVHISHHTSSYALLSQAVSLLLLLQRPATAGAAVAAVAACYYSCCCRCCYCSLDRWAVSTASTHTALQHCVNPPVRVAAGYQCRHCTYSTLCSTTDCAMHSHKY
eukprot:8437-Heterococcus_DN1.PRE.6